MSNIVEIRELNKGRASSVDSQGTRKYTRVFLVTTASALVGAQEVENSIPGGRWGNPYLGIDSNDLGAVVVDVKSKAMTPIVWEVTIEYSSKPPLQPGNKGQGGGSTGGGGGSGGQGSGGTNPVSTPSGTPEKIDDPLARPAEVTFSTVKQMRVRDKDDAGTAIRNSAQCRYDPPLEIEDARLAVRIQRNQAVFKVRTIRDYAGGINSHDWFGGEVYTWRCTDIGATLKFENGVWYWQCTYAFEHRPLGSDNGWIVQLLDAGFYELIAQTPPLLPLPRRSRRRTRPPPSKPPTW